MVVRERRLSEVLKRGYSDTELTQLYELGRSFLENGQIKQAETIMSGLTTVAPEFLPAWLGLVYVLLHKKENDAALSAARHAHRLNPESDEATLYLITCLINTGDYNAAGTLLGEVGDRFTSGATDNQNLLRFYRAQLARYQAR